MDSTCRNRCKIYSKAEEVNFLFHILSCSYPFTSFSVKKNYQVQANDPASVMVQAITVSNSGGSWFLNILLSKQRYFVLMILLIDSLPANEC